MKKIIAMLLALSMVLAFAGCAKTEEAPETTSAVVETTAAVVETTVVEETEAAGYMTHEEYIAAALDSEVTIKTHVQGWQGWWDNTITLYCQDEQGAYFVYGAACTEEQAAQLVVGAEVVIHGYKTEWSGEVEIVDATIEINPESIYVPEALDATALLGTDELINYQNASVVFNGMTVEAIEYKNGEPGDDIYVTLSLDGTSYSFCVEVYLTGTDSDVYTTVGTLNVGDVVNVGAFLYWYEGPNPHITSIALAE